MISNELLKQMNLPRYEWRGVINFTGEGVVPRMTIEALDNYFNHFLHPDPDGKCVKCQFPIIATFRQTDSDGTGHCDRCFWPGRRIHHDVGGVIKRMDYLLQYHPDIVSFE